MELARNALGCSLSPNMLSKSNPSLSSGFIWVRRASHVVTVTIKNINGVAYLCTDVPFIFLGVDADDIVEILSCEEHNNVKM